MRTIMRTLDLKQSVTYKSINKHSRMLKNFSDIEKTIEKQINPLSDELLAK